MTAPAPDPVRARAYHRRQLALALLGLGATLAYLAALVVADVGIVVRDAAARVTGRWWLQLPLVIVAVALPLRVITLPLAWLGGWWLPSRFGLLHQPLGSWLRDAVKAAALTGVLTLVVGWLVWGLLLATPWWWLWAAIALFGLQAVVALVAPVWLLPLFYRLVPLEDAALRERLLALAARAGVPALGVWVADQSRKSRTANAAVTGLWGTRRIILFDTLLRDFAPDEVEVVLAHELAHHAHADVWRGLLVQGGLTLAAFWVAHRALAAGATGLGLAEPADLAALPLLALVLLVLGLAALPAGNAWSRRVERQADDFAMALTGKVDAFVGAMERLATLNLAEREPHPVKEWLLYSHPAVGRRIARARQAVRLSDT